VSNLCPSTYVANSYGPNNKQIWKAKLPLKIKIFIRLPLQNAILTKDNLIKRKWKGDSGAFCTEKESVLCCAYFPWVPCYQICVEYTGLYIWDICQTFLFQPIWRWVNGSSHKENRFTWLVWLQFARPFGEQETQFALRGKGLKRLLRLSVWFVLCWYIGQGFRSKRSWLGWNMGGSSEVSGFTLSPTSPAGGRWIARDHQDWNDLVVCWKGIHRWLACRNSPLWLVITNKSNWVYS